MGDMVLTCKLCMKGGPLWRHDIDILSTLLILCERNPPVFGFRSLRSVTQRADLFCYSEQVAECDIYIIYIYVCVCVILLGIFVMIYIMDISYIVNYRIRKLHHNSYLNAHVFNDQSDSSDRPIVSDSKYHGWLRCWHNLQSRFLANIVHGHTSGAGCTGHNI